MKYRKKPVVIEVEAILWTGENREDIIEFLDVRPDVMYLKFRDDLLHIGKENEVLIVGTDVYIIWGNGNTHICFADDFERDFERETK
ncbi:hypothetical protein QUF57_13320 [Bacillus pumilus]|uniref:hypothetical protein n=1 Tax=Bacillus pumilus TaxID=1408 RepID=UPI0025A216ED|nr:hypothetical protein [Bacillus pumilus]MDM5320954.1 hypothetical protein [Bacillus pumilus]